MSELRPITILIAAMGGEGGGVLTNWIIDAAAACGFPVQSTSIPGVAQRTGATTYYIEIVPRALDYRPLLSLNPVPGEVDVMVASEFLEAGRAIANGFVTPDRTVLIASTHRVFAIAEKSAMGDGRFDMGRLFRAAAESARETVLFDMDEAARASGSILNAVLLGAIAGSGKLPIAPERFAAAVGAAGKAVDSNLAGFEFGLRHARGEIAALARAEAKRAGAGVALASLVARIERDFPAPAHEVLREGVKRLTDYQDAAYATQLLDLLLPVRDAERAGGGDGALVRETARHLALRLSYEDVIRVAQLKTAPGRLARIRAEVRAKAHEPVVVTEHFKPGRDEIAAILPQRLGAWVARRADGRQGRGGPSLHVKTTSVAGFALLRALAGLRRWRRRTHRFALEQQAIAAWLAAVCAAAAIDLRLAAEIAECARLIKGYGDTHARGTANYARIFAAVIQPALARPDQAAAARAAVGLAQARTAALADPEGDSLARTLASLAPPPEVRAAE
jgi:indolepyruvate ferredoxin oxidoreductase beta subunit